MIGPQPRLPPKLHVITTPSYDDMDCEANHAEAAGLLPARVLGAADHFESVLLAKAPMCRVCAVP
jgi:hypothetical protein